MKTLCPSVIDASNFNIRKLIEQIKDNIIFDGWLIEIVQGYIYFLRAYCKSKVELMKDLHRSIYKNLFQ